MANNALRFTLPDEVAPASGVISDDGFVTLSQGYEGVTDTITLSPDMLANLFRVIVATAEAAAK